MSSFLNLTPCMRIVLENAFLRKTYPYEGSVNAIMDTGYEGFASIPNSIFQGLGLNMLEVETRRIALANGGLSNTRGSYATLRIPHLSMKIDGFVETFQGLDEIILGVEALSEMKVTLDYCTRRIRMEKCR
ncbi:MAG: clan AA aspartic protease [Nitrososphaerales archaeon]